jgi:peptidoglycan/LPS O-acetylase OafA/YrhL
MEQRTQYNLIKWFKRIAASATIVVWLYVMIIFIKNPAPFSELVPYCMGSTMLIFGVLTGIFKGLEYWEEQLKKDEGNT